MRFDFEAHGFGQSNVVLDPDHWAIIPRIDKSGLWRCTYREEGTLSEEEVRRRLPDRYALFAPGMRECKPEAVSPYRVHDRCIDSFRIGRVLLAGDAAHVVNPIGGLGLTGGLLDAVSLSDALSAVIHGERPPAVLDAWARERRRVFLEVTAPIAKENRRRVSERDPERRRADAARLASLTNDPALARQALLAVFQLVGRDVLTTTSLRVFFSRGSAWLRIDRPRDEVGLRLEAVLGHAMGRRVRQRIREDDVARHFHRREARAAPLDDVVRLQRERPAWARPPSGFPPRPARRARRWRRLRARRDGSRPRDPAPRRKCSRRGGG